MLQLVLLFGFREREDLVDRFLFCITDKATGVDLGDLTLIIKKIMRNGVPVGHELAHQQFRIDQVLGPTQGANIYISFYHILILKPIKDYSPKSESTNSFLLKTCRSSTPSPSPIYFTGMRN